LLPLSDPRILTALAAAGILLAATLWIVFHRRLTPEEKERRRRVAVNKSRRTVEGLITEAGPEIIHYQYELRGVAYFASQEVRALRDLLPADPERLVGPVSVKYDPRNPANSIVVCEDWSGLPKRAEPAPPSLG
jgi:hypothetical protein